MFFKSGNIEHAVSGSRHIEFADRQTFLDHLPGQLFIFMDTFYVFKSALATSSLRTVFFMYFILFYELWEQVSTERTLL